MSHMGETPFGEALTPMIPSGAQSHFPPAHPPRAGAVSFDSPGFTATLRAMLKLLAPLLAAAVLFALGACARGKPKSSAHVYEGDAPSIKFSNKPESAGGHINTY
jgi:hypothetical protein